jgi:Leucine-rich repeat (LRR) protein/predicted ATPase
MAQANGIVSISDRLDLTDQKLERLDNNEELKKLAKNLVNLDFSRNKISSLQGNDFAQLTKLTHLYFSNNLLEKLPPKVFHNLKKLNVLDMSNNKIASLNQNQFISLLELANLKIHNNSLVNLDVKLFKEIGKTLEYLDISNNRLDQLETSIFDSLTNLKHLNFYMNNISKLEPNHFKSLIKLEYLDFSNNKIENLDESLFDSLISLKELTLHTNNIGKIEKAHLKSLSKLEKLDFSNNKIENLEESIFENLINLKKLYMHHNRLTKLNPKIFKTLTQLEKLNLSHNKIESISANLFDSLVNLKHLDLNSNHDLNDLNTTLCKLKLLEYLNFSSNKIVGLNKNIFDNFTNLKKLIFGNNQINALKSSLFFKLENLEHLQFSNNNLESLAENLFENLHRLHTLEFSDNQIGEIKVDLFKNLSKLERLVFSRNRIKTLNAKTFNNLTNLKYLDFSGNRIEKLDSNLFKGLRKLSILVLSNNLVEHLDSDDLFKDLVELTNLDMNNNLIKEILLPDIFKKLEKLNFLVLSNNRLDYLHADLFQSLVNLKLLNLSSNNLAMDTFDLFKTLSNLNCLILFNNKIEKLDVETCIEKLNKIEFLDLSSNLLTELSYKIDNNSSGHTCLKELFLSDNKICSIQSKFFAENFPSLETLELARNELDRFDPKCLANKNIKISLFGNKFDLETLRKNMKCISQNYSKTDKGFLSTFSMPSFVTWENIPLFSVVTGVNGIGKTTLLKSIQKQLEEDEDNIFPLFLKVHDTIICHDENNFVKSSASKIDAYKFDHVDSKAFLKLRQKGSSILSFASINLCLAFLKSDIVNEKINKEHLGEKFKYGLKWIKDTKSCCLFKINSDSQNHSEINNLSPGEQLIFLCLLWQYIYKKFKVNGRTVVLFDEPDAHLHPASVKSFIKILTELVELGVQVIMTTHNPTTVSLVANENLFHLEFDQSIEKLMIKRVESKNEAIDFLTENFVYVTEIFKLVFTEGNGKSDNLFFNHVKNVSYAHRKNNTPLIFRSMGSSEFRYFFDKNIIKKESSENFNQVDKILFGVVDGDKSIINSYEYFLELARKPEFSNDFDANKLEKKLEETRKILDNFNQNLLRLNRYAIENYIYDPINIFFSLKNGPKQEFLVFPPKFDDYLKDSLSGFLNRKDLKLKTKEELLNEIIEKTSNTLIDHLQNDFLGIKKEQPELGKLGDSFINRFGFKDNNDLKKVLETCRRLPPYDKVKLVFLMDNRQHTLSLKYNPLLIFLKGHLIESIFNSKLDFLKDANGKKINWHDKLINDGNTGFIFTDDLNEMMKILAE